MKTTTPPTVLNLDFASAAAPPDLPAVIAPAEASLPAAGPPPREIVQKALTPDALTKMLTERRQRHDGWTPIRVGAFIEHLAANGSVTRAADYAGMSVGAAYHLRRHPDAEGFRDAWDAAVAVRFETLQELAMDRVVNGVEKARWNGEMVIGHDRVFSDRLLIHMLNRLDPDRDRSLAVPGEAAVRRTVADASGVLPMAADFVVAAAVETGKLGWDPDHDDAELDPETAAEVEKIHARQAAHKANIAAQLAQLNDDARIRNEAFEADKLMREEDAAWERDYADLESTFKSCTLNGGRGPRQRHR